MSRDTLDKWVIHAPCGMEHDGTTFYDTALLRMAHNLKFFSYLALGYFISYFQTMVQTIGNWNYEKQNYREGGLLCKELKLLLFPDNGNQLLSWKSTQVGNDKNPIISSIIYSLLTGTSPWFYPLIISPKLNTAKPWHCFLFLLSSSGSLEVHYRSRVPHSTEKFAKELCCCYKYC